MNLWELCSRLKEVKDYLKDHPNAAVVNMGCDFYMRKSPETDSEKRLSKGAIAGLAAAAAVLTGSAFLMRRK